jgi:hypothetical protein
MDTQTRGSVMVRCAVDWRASPHLLTAPSSVCDRRNDRAGGSARGDRPLHLLCRVAALKVTVTEAGSPCVVRVRIVLLDVPDRIVAREGTLNGDALGFSGRCS